MARRDALPPPPPDDFCEDRPQLALVPMPAPNADSVLAAWADAPRKKERKVTWTLDSVISEVEEMIARAQSGEENVWEEARSKHMVGLLARCYRNVYGAPLSLSSQERARAMFAAANMLRVDFGGDAGEMVEYLRWGWQREQHRENERRAGRRPAQQAFTWTTFFCARFLLNDYRLGLARERDAEPSESGIRMVATR